MIEYVVAHNPDDRVIEKACALLRAGELVVLPSDTSWVAVCDPFTKTGPEKLRKLKRETIQKHFSFLCDSISRASEVANIEDNIFRMIKRHIPGHYTFIFEANKKIIKAIKASKTDKEIGLRFPPNPLVKALISKYENVLACTNITREILGLAEDEDIYSYMFEDQLANIIKMVLDPGEVELVGPTTIISFYPNDIELVRVGAGATAPFGF